MKMAKNSCHLIFVTLTSFLCSFNGKQVVEIFPHHNGYKKTCLCVKYSHAEVSDVFIKITVTLTGALSLRGFLF